MHTHNCSESLRSSFGTYVAVDVKVFVVFFNVFVVVDVSVFVHVDVVFVVVDVIVIVVLGGKLLCPIVLP